jgi:phage terminase Nu1 subunit (DNA packaging protein)
MTVISLPVPSARQANKAQVAEWFNVSVATVDAWLRRGCPSVQRGDKSHAWVFDLLYVAEWRFGKPEKEENINPEDMSPKERRDWYEGEKVRVELEISKGNLITLDQYREELARILKQLANTLETLPDTLERKCALPPASISAMQAELDKERMALVARLEVSNECAA